MTWSKFDDAAPKSPKARAAGNEAWGLWVGAVIYCNRHLTDGLVSVAALAMDCLPEPITLAKAKKLAERLCDAKAQPEGVGLFERTATAGMYRVHDFLDWNLSKTEVESKRKADRDRKRSRGGGGTDGSSEGARPPPGIPAGTPPGSREGIPTGIRPDSPARVPTPEGAHVPVPSHPIPAAAVGGNGSGPIQCPADLRLSAAQVANLQMGTGLDEAQIMLLTLRFTGKHAENSSDLRPLDVWKKCLWSAVCGDASDPKKRPPRAEPDVIQVDA